MKILHDFTQEQAQQMADDLKANAVKHKGLLHLNELSWARVAHTGVILAQLLLREDVAWDEQTHDETMGMLNSETILLVRLLQIAEGKNE